MALRRRAEAALAADGVDRTRLGYEVLVKLKVDDLLEQEGVQMSVAAGGGCHRDQVPCGSRAAGGRRCSVPRSVVMEWEKIPAAYTSRR